MTHHWNWECLFALACFTQRIEENRVLYNKGERCNAMNDLKTLLKALLDQFKNGKSQDLHSNDGRRRHRVPSLERLDFMVYDPDSNLYSIQE